ncbi:hypothetical protein uan_111 [Pseudomonas phage UAntarctica]|nr:hypothetical protein uan_111 [Pseudomonas phage UAntarctica]
MRYFVDESRRLVRTGSVLERFYEPWKEVTSQEYDAFRAETAKISPKKLKELRKPK